MNSNSSFLKLFDNLRKIKTLRNQLSQKDILVNDFFLAFLRDSLSLNICKDIHYTFKQEQETINIGFSYFNLELPNNKKSYSRREHQYKKEDLDSQTFSWYCEIDFEENIKLEKSNIFKDSIIFIYKCILNIIAKFLFGIVFIIKLMFKLLFLFVFNLIISFKNIYIKICLFLNLEKSVKDSDLFLEKMNSFIEISQLIKSLEKQEKNNLIYLNKLQNHLSVEHVFIFFELLFQEIYQNIENQNQLNSIWEEFYNNNLITITDFLISNKNNIENKSNEMLFFLRFIESIKLYKSLNNSLIKKNDKIKNLKI